MASQPRIGFVVGTCTLHIIRGGTLTFAQPGDKDGGVEGVGLEVHGQICGDSGAIEATQDKRQMAEGSTWK